METCIHFLDRNRRYQPSASYQPEIPVTDQLGPECFGSFDIDCSLLPGLVEGALPQGRTLWLGYQTPKPIGVANAYEWPIR
jgi:hypothetical protein